LIVSFIILTLFFFRADDDINDVTCMAGVNLAVSIPFYLWNYFNSVILYSYSLYFVTLFLINSVSAVYFIEVTVHFLFSQKTYFM